MRNDTTRAQSESYSLAYDYFNEALFGGSLGPCLLNFSRKANSKGFFWQDRWARRSDGDTRVPEISLNPDLLRRPPVEIMSTLVHEQCHQQQAEQGSPSRSGYHNREWSRMMEVVGLMPSSTGLPGGKRVGQKMSHYVIDGGPFAVAFAGMPEAALLPWVSGGEPTTPPKPKQNKAKYTCPTCGVNTWAQDSPDVDLRCNLCDRDLLLNGRPRPGKAGASRSSPRGAEVAEAESLFRAAEALWQETQTRRADLQQSCKSWFRDLAKKYHPDVRGSNEAMAAINDAFDRLKQILP
jgi:predicted SprT family Zn-dependent metalloprotease